ncbi:MAG: 4-hydroxybenzoate octaprenyltransferase [Marinobacter sp.]
MIPAMLQNALPEHIHTRLTDYAKLLRIDRPIGTLLLLWPTWWALWLAGEGSPAIANVVVFTLGVFFMRAAGCAINDFADRDLDRHVKRTKDRPLTSGRIKAWEALALFGGLCLVSFLMVLLFTNPLTLYLSFGGALLAFIYPFMKRHTHLPQLFLGAAFSWAIPMAWAAEANALSQLTWLLFTANVLWTVAYDTLYAMVDRDDDVKIGIKSTAVLFGEADRAIIGVLQAMVIIILVMVGGQAELGSFYYLGVAVMAALFVYQQYLAKDRSREGCFKAFLNNNWAGFAVFSGLILDLMT